jgi:hypothetical protein
MLTLPVKLWKSSLELPKLCDPLVYDSVAYITDELIIYCVAVIEPVTTKLPWMFVFVFTTNPSVADIEAVAAPAFNWLTVKPENAFIGMPVNLLPSPTNEPVKNEADNEPETLDSEPIISINFLFYYKYHSK